MNRLKELRQEKKLTQQELADIAEVSKRTYIYWENGESQIKPDKAQKLADYFGVDVGFLLGYNEGQQRVRELLGIIPEKGTMGIISMDELLDVYDLGFIKDKKILDELQRDTAVAIKFLESIQYKLLLFGSISEDYTRKLEEFTSFLLDLYESAERRKEKMTSDNDS